MSLLSRAVGYWPRKEAGLPPGQRRINNLPRFSDKPFRWAPALGQPVLRVSIEGESVAEVDLSTWAATNKVERTHDLHCVTTWSYREIQWGGFVLSELLDAAGATTGDLPPFAKAVAADKVHAVFMTKDLLEPSVLLATERDSAPLDRRHGGALRLVCPTQYGYKNVKHLIEVDFCGSRPHSTTGKKEHLRARVALEERHSTLPNWLVRIPYRLAIVPTALASDRSLRKSP